MMEQGGLLDRVEVPPRAVLFAGETFAIKYVRDLQRAWPSARLMNLYGPTETNVCTFHEVTGDLASATEVLPIGRACCGDEVWAVKADGGRAAPGEEGELSFTVPTVMLGYWGKAPQSGRPYATGDIVRCEGEGGFRYVSRRDQMVKVRGHRIEPGEVEAALCRHPAIREAAVVVAGSGMEAKLLAFVVVAAPLPSLLALKKHCAEHVPRYMIIDRVREVDRLPRTSSGKIDRRKLLATYQGEATARRPAEKTS